MPTGANASFTVCGGRLRDESVHAEKAQSATFASSEGWIVKPAPTGSQRRAPFTVTPAPSTMIMSRPEPTTSIGESRPITR